MSLLRLLLPGSAVVGDLDDERADVVQALADLYAYPTPVPASGWVRANMVSTLDGSASGADGLSGTIGGAADRMVFRVLRGLADVVVVGAGTARAEGYHVPAPSPDFAERRAQAGQAPAPVLALVTRSGRLPEAGGLFTSGEVTSRDATARDATSRDATARNAAAGGTLVVTCSDADVDGLRARLGPERVVVAGEEDVDPVIAVAQLAARGLPRVLLEGGPRLLGRFESSARLDELCLTTSPLAVAGDGPRIAHDTDRDGKSRSATLRMRLAHLVECDGLLLGRWLVQPS